MIKLTAFLPFLSWFRGYGSDQLKGDILSGLTVALVLIPQSMAYAQLAGLPSYYGLYASFLPPALAALFGSSRQLATGPVAVVSLMTAVAIEPLAVAGSQAFIAYAILLSLIVGGFQFLLGVLRLGLVVNFLSHPVVNGFTNAAAIVIASSQLSKLLGVHVDKAPHHYETVIRVIQAAVSYCHMPTLFMGILAFGIMFFLKRLSSTIPNILVAVVFTTIVSWAMDFENNIRVSATRIDHPETMANLNGYNKTAVDISALMAKRAELNKNKRLAEQKKDVVGVINIQRDEQITNHLIKQGEEAAAELRKKLRNQLLVQVPADDGTFRFYPVSHAHQRSKIGGIWRIHVGRGPLDMDSLMLKGGGDVVGSIPRGIPALSVPELDTGVVLGLLPSAVIISLLGFMEAISIAKAMAAKTGQRIDPNQELIGQGIANLIGAMAKSYPAAGSFSRSAVNLQAGAFSGLSSVFASAAVVVTLLFLTPLLYHLPQAVLAAIIMMAVAGLFNINGVLHAWRARWYDGVISIITFVCTLMFAPHLDRGIMVGAGLSLGVFLYKSMRPKVVDLSLGVDMTLHNAVASGLKECRYVDVVRFDGPLFFANASYLEEQIRNRRLRKTKLKHIIIAAEGITDIDASGQEALSLTVDRVRSAGIDISLSSVNERVLAVLKRTHLLAKIGEDHVYPAMEKAIASIHEQTHRGGREKNCPLTHVVKI